ncbi:hypothetical protein RYX36_026540, partial [Vicia faba]
KCWILNSDFKKGDLVWGITNWEEYSIITKTDKTMLTLIIIFKKMNKLNVFTHICLDVYRDHNLIVLFSYVNNVKTLKSKFGFDEAFNYKEEQDLDATLKKYFPDRIDIYFDNVSGDVLEEALVNMRRHNQIIVVGMISQYELDEPQGIKNWST